MPGGMEDGEMTTAAGSGDYRLTNPKPRGCGMRSRGGVYCCCGLGPEGRPIEYYLFCPPYVYTEGFHRAPRLVDVGEGTNNGIVIWIGEQFYPYPSDFIEEARDQGVSRRIPGNWPLDKLTLPAWMVMVHAKSRLVNALSLGLGVTPYCPKDKHDKETGIITSECLGRSWELAPPTVYVAPNDLGLLHGHKRKIASTQYTVFPPGDGLRPQPIELVKGKETIVRPAYEHGIFAMFPLTHIEYVKSGNVEKDEKTLSRALQVPIVGVKE